MRMNKQFDVKEPKPEPAPSSVYNVLYTPEP